ncbi:M20 family metallopeptidase [Pelolinea submarina]|uniref:Probable succinyl-diaminopimelate desuccinylase n=1 Tax=Pelolinea submarina TaxID=913107 RepID=A0A347ZPZ6_9CHLR|nr:M20 family metallopeptidase [Pelolinea submarina]REG06294.1 succinyl-diaminopimelate desuccinylase [Pelolinea submarina]BBB47377.1 succinyl-diaminopimelate desuccinylase [Pelolinea submarina]
MVEKENNSVITLCQDLIRFNTSNPPGNELAAALFVEARLRQAGFETSLIKHDENRATLLAMLEGRPQSDTFLFVGHLDTVPCGDLSKWERDPFEAFCDGERIIGRGASDMKGGLTALLTAAEVVKGRKVNNTIILAFTADEESGCLGAISLLDIPRIKDTKMLLIPEPTSNQIGVAEKGALWVRISARGKSAHGSMPDQGINAINEIIALMNALDLSDFELEKNNHLGTFTHSLNTISGGIKTNIIPDSCEISMDIRTLPTQNHRDILTAIAGAVKQVTDQHPEYAFSCETVISKPGLETNCGQAQVARIVDLIQSSKKDVNKIGLNYYTDAAVLVPALNVPFLLFGPGDADQAHATNEKLDLSKLYQSCEIYSEILKKIAFE